MNKRYKYTEEYTDFTDNSFVFRAVVYILHQCRENIVILRFMKLLCPVSTTNTHIQRVQIFKKGVL